MFRKFIAFLNKPLLKNDQSVQSFKSSKKTINLIYVGLGFGVFYWIMESVRDVLVYDRGSILERIFTPGFMAFWMRMLVIFIILLFSVYAQTIRKKIKTKKDRKQNIFGLLQISLLFGLLYWIIEAFRDTFVFNKGGFLERLLTPDPTGFWMRLLPLLILILFGIYAQSLINDQKKVEEGLRLKKDELQNVIRERTRELLKSNSQLQKEFEEKDIAQKELKRVNRALRTLLACNKTIVNAVDEDKMIAELCRLLVETGGYHWVWVGDINTENPSPMILRCQEGYKESYLKLRQSFEYILIEDEDTLKLLRSSCQAQILHFVNSSSTSAWVLEAQKLGFKSAICLPLILHNELIGVLSIFTKDHLLDDENENDLLIELAGDLSFGIATLRMQSEHVEVVQTLKDSEEKYGTISENLNVGIFRYRLAEGGQFIEVNPALIEMLGFPDKNTFLSLQFSKLFQFQTDLKNIHKQMQESGKLNDKEILMKRYDGEPIWCSINATAVYDENNVMNYYDGVVDNISQRKALEKEKKEMQLQLFQAQKMEEVGVLAGGVAHDFNNLLTAMLGISEIAMMTLDETDTIYKDMKELHALAERGAGITRQLLVFSRKQHMEFDTVYLNKTIESMGKMLNRLMVANVKIENQLDPGLWPCFGDQGTLEQVVMNLVVNARDAMPEGGMISVRTENVTLDAEQALKIPEAYEGQFVRLSVQDEGTGIEPAILKKIFEPFFSTKCVGKGTGLGLSVVFGIVKQHKGFIHVDSVLNHGTTFHVYIPADPEHKIAQKKKSIDLTNKQGQSQRVLFIEDDDTIRECMTSGLKEKGYDVFDAPNAQKAMQIFFQEHGQFQFAISDVVLPDENGFRLIGELLSYNPTLKVILNSGYSDEKSCRPMIEEHGLKFIQKPFTFKQLMQAMDEMG